MERLQLVLEKNIHKMHPYMVIVVGFTISCVTSKVDANILFRCYHCAPGTCPDSVESTPIQQGCKSCATISRATDSSRYCWNFDVADGCKTKPYEKICFCKSNLCNTDSFTTIEARSLAPRNLVSILTMILCLVWALFLY